MAVKRSASIKITKIILSPKNVDEKKNIREIECERLQAVGVSGDAIKEERNGALKMTLSVPEIQPDKSNVKLLSPMTTRSLPQSTSSSADNLNSTRRLNNTANVKSSVKRDGNKQIPYVELSPLKTTTSSGNLGFAVIKELEGNKMFLSKQQYLNRLSKSLTDVDYTQFEKLESPPQLMKRPTAISKSKRKIERRSVSLTDLQEILKTVKDVPKGLNVPLDNKFPVDDEIVQTRRNTSRHTRNVKTTDYDSRKKVSDANNFEIRGVIKLKGTSEKSTYIIKPKDEYILYENENLYRVNPTKKEMLKHGVVIRSARHLNTKSKEPVEVELKDKDGGTYTLTFASPKYAKQFIDSDRLPIYVPDQNRGIADKLLKLLGKRSSREILERKGIYKNEPIFGNTLKEIYHKSQNPVPPFICKIVELIEKPENIKSMGLYRTSGNLATIQKIRLAADNGRLDILDNFSKDPDVLTGSLKLFFRELKEPLMPYCIFNQMADIIKIPLNQLTTKDHQKIRSIIVKYMYESNLATFRVIMRHLVEVVKHKEDNKMDAYNLAICWGPSLIFPNVTIGPESTIESTKDLVSLSHDATRLTDFLIGYYQMYPAELGGRPESFNEKTLSSLKRQESRDSIESADSSTKSYKKSNSNLSLSVDEVMKRAIEYIEMNLNAEGLYSRSGTPDKTNKILKKLSKKKSTELDKYRNEVHDICNALMIYIKELPEPLVDYNTVETLAKIYSNSQNHLESNLRRDVMVIIEKTARKDSLIFLLRHLAKVFNNQPLHKVSRSEMIIIWTKVLNHGFRVTENNEQFAKFLTVAVEVFNDNLPDLVKSSFNNNGSSHNRNENMAELLKDLRQHQERDRNSRYDNIDCEEIDEATLLDQKTEQTKL
ncbi:uncharacterized protein LOC143193764 isoform X3 [Rhynchophorus ferrugineus]|uniref:uncharacterized protein LOC143193764 isoform X3 n=1 Tax=Rhynchophorus ferrugineus TaxID=354439 RepID=UPI003FCECAE6